MTMRALRDIPPTCPVPGAGRWSRRWRRPLRRPRIGIHFVYPIFMPLLTVLSMVTTLVAPRLLGPEAFGSYSLLLSIYLIAARSDLGLAQLGDRRLARTPPGEVEGTVGALLHLRARIGIGTLLVLLPLVLLDATLRGLYSPLDALLAVLAGICAMIAAGPAMVFRAQRKTREFTRLALVLHFGLTLPRLAGLLVAGSTGCFAVMTLWFGAVAFAVRRRRDAVACRAMLAWPTLRISLPLFVMTTCWTLYMMAGRWIAGLVSTPDQFGLLAFAFTLVFIGVNTIAAIGDVRYPYWLARLAGAKPRACSASITREVASIALACSVVIALVNPFGLFLMTALFPAYVDAVPAVVVLAIGSVPLVGVGWLLPILVATTPTPFRHALMLFLPGSAALVGGMVVGQDHGGIVGQAWGACLAAVVLQACVLGLMTHLAILRPRAGLALLLSQVGLVGVLTLLAPAESNAAAVPPSGWRLVFDDDFSTLDLWNGTGGRWQAQYPWGGRTNNNELEYYLDPRSEADRALRDRFDPFSTGSGHLTITARPVSQHDARTIGGLTYVSGLLTTARSFAFTYGYIEMHAQVPAGRGLWPAFWLLPERRAWPPEIDVMEVLGHDTRQYWATLHSVHDGKRQEIQARVTADDLSKTPHRFGVLWTAKEISWYLDGRRVASAATPADLHQAMYLLVNLAVGGKWAGAPDVATAFPATLHVFRIRVFQPLDTISPDGKS